MQSNTGTSALPVARPSGHAQPSRWADRRLVLQRSVRHTLVVILASTALALLPAGPVAGTFVSEVEWEVLERVNRFREANGVRELRMGPRVRRVAGARAASMARLDYFAHVSPSGIDAGDMLRARGVRADTWGEVIGWTSGMRLRRASRWMVDWWKQSTKHRALLLSGRFDIAGVGIARDGRRTIWTIVLVG